MSFDDTQPEEEKSPQQAHVPELQSVSHSSQDYTNPNLYNHNPVPSSPDLEFNQEADDPHSPEVHQDSPGERRAAAILNVVSKTLIMLTVIGLSFAGGWFANQFFTNQAFQNNNASAYLQLYQQAFNTIDQKYVDRDAVDYKKMTYAAIDAMVKSLNDGSHSRFLTPDDVKAENQQLSGKLIGIGVYLHQDPDTKKLIITAPIPNSPAEKAGIKPNDEIIAVNGVSTVGKDQSEVSQMIQGQEGTDVQLTIKRPGTAEPIDFKMTRSAVKIEIVQSYLIPGTTTAHIQITQFADGAGKDLRNALNDVKAKGATKIILDLRNDPGGYLREAVDVASAFLPNDSVVMISQDSKGNKTPQKVNNNPIDTTTELIVLTNKNSASAAEIVASALHDNGRATLIGETTFGTGTVLYPYELSDGSEILLGVEEWLTPKGEFIREKGVQPDITVVGSKTVLITPFDGSSKSLNEEQIRALNDPQLNAALDFQPKK